jgi:RimJ/RimL family protein N-acetyltransferase
LPDALQLIRDVPESFETPRLLIRAPRPGDGPEFNAAILETLPDIRRWLGLYLDGAPTVGDSEAFVRAQHARFLLRKNFMLLAFDKATGRLAVSSGLHKPDWRVPSFEIGYWCRTACQRQGYVTEVVRGITDFAVRVFGARRLEIRCDVDNITSAGVAQRAGFVLEGTLRCDSRDVTGALRDTHIFARVRPDR